MPRIFPLCIAMALLSAGFVSFAAEEQADQSAAKIKAERSVNGEAAGQAQKGDKPWVAVHDFTVSAELQESGISGWSLAEKLEAELVKQGRSQFVTRAKIAKVLKEQKFGAEGSLETAKLGKLIGAEFIVTGELDRKGSRLILIAKMIDVSKETGKIEKSFSAWRDVGQGKFDLACLSGLLETIAKKLEMTPPEFLEYGRQKLAGGDLEEARDAFMEVYRVAPSPEIKEAIAKIETTIQEKQKAAETVLAEASKLFLQAKDILKADPGSSASGEIFDSAASKIEDMLYSPKAFLSSDQRSRSEALLSQIREIKKGLYNGPSEGKIWNVPELSLEMLPIKAGKFKMGDPDADNGSDNPQRNVTISRPFWIGKTEVSIAQFLFHLKTPNTDPAEAKLDARDNEIDWSADTCPITKSYTMKDGKGETWGDDKMPIVQVSWVAADNFCQWLTRRERAAKRLPKGYVYRLPSEAEWEYSCRAGSLGNYFFGDSPEQLGGFAWFSDSSGASMRPVGQKKPNPWGLCDTYGNAWEWCRDWYDGGSLAMDVSDPKGAARSEDDLKVVRGGSYSSSAPDASSINRYSAPYKKGRKNIGFRIVLAPEL